MGFCTSCGSAIVEGNRFCTSCGTEVAAAVDSAGSPKGDADGDRIEDVSPAVTVEPAAPAQVAEPSTEETVEQTAVASAAASPTSQVPPPSGEVELSSTEATSRGWKRPAAVIAGVTLLAVVIVGGIMVLRGDDDGVASEAASYQGPDDEIVVLEGGGDVALATYGSDDRPDEFLDDARFESARVLSRGMSGRAVDAGGPIIGTSWTEDGASVISVDVDTAEVTELLEDGENYDVFIDPESSDLLVVEYRSSSARCYVGPADGDLVRVARADNCVFSPEGSYVMSQEFDDDEVEFEVSDFDGNRILVGDSARSPRFLDDEHLLIYEGSSDRTSVVLIETVSGQAVAESARAASVSVLDTNLGGYVLVASHDNDGEAVLEVLGTDGSAYELVTSEGTLEAAFAEEDRADAFVIGYEDGTAQLSEARLDASSSEVTLERVGDDVQTLLIPPDGQRSGRFVAASVEPGDADGVLLVGTDVGIVEIDIDEFAGVVNTTFSADGGYAVVEVRRFDDESTLTSALFVDLVDGTSQPVVEDWASLLLADEAADGSSFVVVGTEEVDDRDVAVANVSVDGVIEIVDESADIRFAGYSPDGSSVIFSTFSDGDYETLEYQIGERTRPELRYRDFGVSAVGWAGISSGRGRGPASFDASPPSEFCDAEYPGLEVVYPGFSPATATLAESGFLSFCLEVPQAGTRTVEVLSDFDVFLEVVGGGDYASDQTSDVDQTVRVSEQLSPGAYQIYVSALDGSSGTVVITAT